MMFLTLSGDSLGGILLVSCIDAKQNTVGGSELGEIADALSRV